MECIISRNKRIIDDMFIKQNYEPVNEQFETFIEEINDYLYEVPLETFNDNRSYVIQQLIYIIDENINRCKTIYSKTLNPSIKQTLTSINNYLLILYSRRTKRILCIEQRPENHVEFYPQLENVDALRLEKERLTTKLKEWKMNYQILYSSSEELRQENERLKAELSRCKTDLEAQMSEEKTELKQENESLKDELNKCKADIDKLIRERSESDKKKAEQINDCECKIRQLKIQVLNLSKGKSQKMNVSDNLELELAKTELTKTRDELMETKELINQYNSSFHDFINKFGKLRDPSSK
jgi:hypothetical protein